MTKDNLNRPIDLRSTRFRVDCLSSSFQRCEPLWHGRALLIVKAFEVSRPPMNRSCDIGVWIRIETRLYEWTSPNCGESSLP
jgi:hypothetical protein